MNKHKDDALDIIERALNGQIDDRWAADAKAYVRMNRKTGMPMHKTAHLDALINKGCSHRERNSTGCRVCAGFGPAPKTVADLMPADVFNDPTASFWLKEALSKAMDRDPIDAANDAQALSIVLLEHMRRVLPQRA